MSDIYRPFGEEFSATKDEIETRKHEYRFVNIGAWMNMIAYSCFVPVAALVIGCFYAVDDFEKLDISIQLLLVGSLLLSVFVSVIFMCGAAVFFLFAPEQDEKLKARKYITFCVLAPIASVVLKFLGLGIAGALLQNILSGLAVLALIELFQFVGKNIENDTLESNAIGFKRFYTFWVILIFLLFCGNLIAGGFGQIFGPIILLLIAIFLSRFIWLMWAVVAATR